MAGKQFRQGITLAGLFQKFPDGATAEAWFVEQRWGGEPACPHCGSYNVQTGAAHKTMPFRCRDCRKRFSVRTGTTMQASNLGYQVWAIATYLLTTSLKGVSSMKLHRDLGITQKSAWHLGHRIRAAWKSARRPFGGEVEADETWIGGREANKHRVDRWRVPKVPVAGVRHRQTGHVSAAVVPAVDKPTLHHFVTTRTTPDALVYTDGSAAYHGPPRRREVVHHSVGEYVRGQAHTNGLESFWSALARGHMGVYHKFSPKHLQRYVREFEGRHNARNLDTIDQMERLARGLAGRTLSWRTLVTGGMANG